MIYEKRFKLTKENYHGLEANINYWSASQVKSFLDCEARTMAEISGEYEQPKSDALMVGSYVDAAFESDRAFRAFRLEHEDELYRKDGKLRAEYVKADEMIKRAKSDATFMRFMQGRHQVVMKAELFGVPFKAKFDVLRDSYKVDDKRIVDLKTCRDFKPVYKEGQGRVDFATAWNWPLQMAIYQAVYEKTHGQKLPTYLACISKEDPPDIAIVHVPQEQLDAELDFLAEKMERFKAVKAGIIEPERCENCRWCRMTKKLTEPVRLDWFNENSYVRDAIDSFMNG